MKHMLVAIAVALVSATANATPIATYHTADDGDDWTRAFERAQLACAERGGSRPPLAGLPGCRVELEERVYYVTRSIDVCVPLQVVGAGIGYTLNSSRIETTRTTGFRALRGTCPWNTAMGADGALSLEHVTLLNVRSAPIDGEAPFYGIDADTRIVLNDVGIRDFVRGINLDCDIHENTNCNGSILSAIYIVGSESDGVYTRGGDSNAATFTGLNITGACRDEPRWRHLKEPYCQGSTHVACTQDRLRCAGIFEASFLGNAILGGHVASQNGAAGIVVKGASNHTAVAGTYAENDTSPQYGDAHVTVFGGHNGFSGPLGQLHGARMPGLTIQGDGYDLALGMQTNQANTVWRLSNDATSTYPWRFKLDAPGNLMLDVGNVRPYRAYLPYAASTGFSAWTWGAVAVLLAALLIVAVSRMKGRPPWKRKPPRPPAPPTPPRKDDEPPASEAGPVTSDPPTPSRTPDESGPRGST